MKILAFSDIYKWDHQECLVDRYRPDIVLLGGDLTSDGTAAFWQNALREIPAFLREKNLLMKKYDATDEGGITCFPSGSFSSGRTEKYGNLLARIEDRYRRTPEFLKARKRIHVDKFYEFLNHAGKKSEVLVIKGDHDDDFEGDYRPDRIADIPGCREISGKTHSTNEMRFLGLGFEQAGYRRPLKQLVTEFRDKVEIVIAHAPKKNLALITELRPKLLIRGHHGGGKHVINGIPTLFTSDRDALVKIGKTGRIQIESISTVPAYRDRPWGWHS